MSGANKIYAAIDTNVLVSSLFSSNGESNPAKVIRAVLSGKITPLYNDEILAEYRDVLSRDKFKFDNYVIDNLISVFTEFGANVSQTKAEGFVFPDQDDIVFYEVTLSVDGSYLVTGNIKHFPIKPFVVTPAEMVRILDEE